MTVSRRGEHPETVVWETRLAGEGAQGGPAGAVVEVVQGVDEVRCGPVWQVGPGQRAHVPSRPRARLGSGCPVLSAAVNRGADGSRFVVSIPRSRSRGHVQEEPP